MVNVMMATIFVQFVFGLVAANMTWMFIPQHIALAVYQDFINSTTVVVASLFIDVKSTCQFLLHLCCHASPIVMKEKAKTIYLFYFCITSYHSRFHSNEYFICYFYSRHCHVSQFMRRLHAKFQGQTLALSLIQMLQKD